MSEPATAANPFEDEVVAAAPASSGGGFEIEGGLFDEIHAMGEPIGIGTYHFRMSGYTAKDKDGQPYYEVRWECQEEPHVGRSVLENFTWANKDTFEAAAAGDLTAKTTLKKRLWRIKALMDACQLQPRGKFDIERDFLNQNPEVKIQLGVEEAMARQGDQLVKAGYMRDRIIRYLPLIVR